MQLPTVDARNFILSMLSQAKEEQVKEALSKRVFYDIKALVLKTDLSPSNVRCAIMAMALRGELLMEGDGYKLK